MILGSPAAGTGSTAAAVALPAIGRNLQAGLQGPQGTATSYPLTLASLILLAGSLSDHWGGGGYSRPGRAGSPRCRCHPRPRPASDGTSPREPCKVSAAR